MSDTLHLSSTLTDSEKTKIVNFVLSKIGFKEQGNTLSNLVHELSDCIVSPNDSYEEFEEEHVDNFIEDGFAYRSDEEKYARFFLTLKRLSAHLQADFRDMISEYKLFCMYEGKKYRVTGASRLGDVWLSLDHNKEDGYTKRVMHTQCTNWSRE